MSIRNYLLMIMLVCTWLCLPLTTNAQVKIGEEKFPTKGALLDLKKTTAGTDYYLGGLLLPNVEILDLSYIPAAFTDANTMQGYTPADGVDTNTDLAGMVVYNTTVNEAKNIQAGVYFWDGEDWNQIVNLSCADPTILTPSTDQTISEFVNTPVSMSVTVQGGANPSYRWYMNDLPMNPSTYPTAATATLNWTPTVKGTYTFYCMVTNNCQNGNSNIVASKKYTVNVTIHPADLPPGTGTFTGKTCFDIVYGNFSQSCGWQDNRDKQKTNFSLTAEQDPVLGIAAPYTAAQVYTFTPPSTVSNVRFIAVDEDGDIVESITPKGDYTGTISVGTPCKAVVKYKESLNTDLHNLTNDVAKKLKLYAVYTSNSVDYSVLLNISLQDCSCCGAYIAAGEWRAFMCHNLGVTNENLDPLTPVKDINGSYYQWGRKAAVANVNTNANAISGWPAAPAGSTLLLDATKTTNDPCPSGWRIPTNAQWQGVENNNSQSWVNTGSEFGSGLKLGDKLFLPAAGERMNTNGALGSRGEKGIYWSSSLLNDEMAYAAQVRSFSSNTEFLLRRSGLSIRCIAE